MICVIFDNIYIHMLLQGCFGKGVESVPFREIAGVIGRRLNLPVRACRSSSHTNKAGVPEGTPACVSFAALQTCFSIDSTAGK